MISSFRFYRLYCSKRTVNTGYKRRDCNFCFGFYCCYAEFHSWLHKHVAATLKQLAKLMTISTRSQVIQFSTYSHWPFSYFTALLIMNRLKRNTQNRINHSQNWVQVSYHGLCTLGLSHWYGKALVSHSKRPIYGVWIQKNRPKNW